MGAEERFSSFADSVGLSTTSRDLSCLMRGARWLAQASSASGVSQYATAEDALLRAMGPALAYFADPEAITTGRLVDIGCGNGALGATIAFFSPNLFVDLVDRAKRAYTIAEVLVARLGLENARVHHAAAQEVRRRWDVAVFRALAPADEALPLAVSLVVPGGHVCAYHRRGDTGFERPTVDLEVVGSYETLVSELSLTRYRR
ncbi:MAG: RsmG family class I SAM-dependent methyltransferase [Armatimonadota bacterium]